MSKVSEPHLVIDALRILTRADQGVLTLSTGSDKCHFDQLLVSNAYDLRGKLDTDPHYSMLQSWWRTDETITIPEQCTTRWDFVLYCLKTLYLLQESLKHTVEEYNKQKPHSIDPSGAPPVSPDTLSFEEQKVVLIAVQFVVCLGISPYLDKGVGIPADMRSEFSVLLRASSDMSVIGEQEKRQRLFTCLKVFMSCIFTPSLGSIILSRHLVDILAGLLQLTHSVKGAETTKISSPEEEKSNAVNDIQKLDTEQISSETESKTISCETNDEKSLELAVEGGTNNKSRKLDTDVSPGSQITPASIVDLVRKSFQDKTALARNSLQNTAEGQNSLHQEIHKAEAEISNTTEKLKDTYLLESDEKTIEGPQEVLLKQSDLEYCEQVVEDLMEKIYPPLLVKTLLLLQGGPRPKKSAFGKFTLPPAPIWLRKVCGKQLTAILMRPKGVQSVLRGMLDSPGEGQAMGQASDWRKCDAVAKLIACCPLQSLSVESYYKTIGPQILEILHITDKQVARQFLRVACNTIVSMAEQYPDLTRQYITVPLIEPLMRCTENIDKFYETNQPTVLLDEGQLACCIEDCHRVFVSGTTAVPQLIQCLQPVILTLFQLLVFTKQGISALRTACHELITTYLKQTELSVTLTGLELMAFQETKTTGHGFIRMHPNVYFSHGSSGGILAVYNLKENTSPNSQDICVQCIVDILKDLQNTGSAGEFLIYMLQELTAILKTEADGNTDFVPVKSSCRDGELLMKLESEYQCKEEQFYRKLMLLNLLAAVCESIGPSCIKNTRNTLEFVRATLERVVEICRATNDSLFELFENETLTMAMGLLTAVLTGAMQVTSTDRKTMEDLLPLLQDISDNHPESSVQEMAADLRITIATHGAVWSATVRAESEDFRQLKTKIQQSATKQRQSTKKQPIIEVISDHSSKIFEENVQGTDSSERPSGFESSSTFVKEKDKLFNERETVDLNSFNSPELNENGMTRDNRNLESEKQSYVSGLPKLESGIIQVSKNLASTTETKKTLVSSENTNGELENAFKELCDPLLPVRGHGLIRLTSMVKRRDKEAYEKRDTVLKIFEENLDHPDSYIYLSSVNGLTAMSEVFPDFMVPRLCEQFASVEKMGKKRSSELRIKLGEILVKASRSLGDMIPKYRDLLLNTVLRGARDGDSMVRASSMSNLGEVCKLLHFSLGNIVHEVFLCCKSLLRSDNDPEVRKGAGVALTMLLQGLEQDTLKVLDTLLLDLYRLLKLVMIQEKDEKVKLNANLALNELEDIMKRVIFPQQKLEKRIRVLDMD